MPARDTTTVDITTDVGKRQTGAAKKRNKIAVANFTIAFTSEGTISMVYKATNADWLDGLAHLIVASGNDVKIYASRYGDSC